MIKRTGKYNPWNKGKKLSKTIKKKMRETANENVVLRKKSGKLGADKRWFGHTRQTPLPTGKKRHKYTIEQKRFTNMRYKARKKQAEGNHTFGEWELLKKQYGYTCPACGKSEPQIKLTEDHIVPLSKGGSDYIENIQPLCVSCNTRKYTKIEVYLKKKGGEKYGNAV
jgi:5-methylcytosine-specific restriction endonuclease McrA